MSIASLSRDERKQVCPFCKKRADNGMYGHHKVLRVLTDGYLYIVDSLSSLVLCLEREICKEGVMLSLHEVLLSSRFAQSEPKIGDTGLMTGSGRRTWVSAAAATTAAATEPKSQAQTSDVCNHSRSPDHRVGIKGGQVSITDRQKV